MISISDCLCKLGYIKCELKLIKIILIILIDFTCIILELACKIIFLVIFKAKCLIVWSFIENLRHNYQITEKKLINLDC